MPKLEKTNEDGVLIIKEVADEMLTLYLNIGWKQHEEKKEIKEEVKEIETSKPNFQKFKGKSKNRK